MKDKKTNQILDLQDAFDDVSLYQLIPSGTGMSLSHLKTIVDAVHNGGATLNSVLLTGKEGLNTHASALLRALAVDNVNEIDASFLRDPTSIHQFFCINEFDGFLISNCEHLCDDVKPKLHQILKEKFFTLYNYVRRKHDVFWVPDIIVLTGKSLAQIAQPIKETVQHMIQLEDYTEQQLILIVLQRLKYSNIDYENETVLQGVVKCGNNNLKLCIQFLKCCVAVMQAEGRQIMTLKDIARAAHLMKLKELEFEKTIPF